MECPVEPVTNLPSTPSMIFASQVQHSINSRHSSTVGIRQFLPKQLIAASYSGFPLISPIAFALNLSFLICLDVDGLSSPQCKESPISLGVYAPTLTDAHYTDNPKSTASGTASFRFWAIILSSCFFFSSIRFALL